MDRNASKNDFQNWPRIIQIAWIVFDSDASILQKPMYFIHHEGLVITEEVKEITSIDEVVIKNHGVHVGIALEQLNKDLAFCSKVVAHNLEFDLNVIGAEFLRLGMSDGFETIDKYCTMTESVELCRIPSSIGFKFPRLEELYYHLFNNSMEQTHRADADVMMTAKCYMRMNDIEIPVRMIDVRDDLPF